MKYVKYENMREEIIAILYRIQADYNNDHDKESIQDTINIFESDVKECFHDPATNRTIITYE